MVEEKPRSVPRRRLRRWPIPSESRYVGDHRIAPSLGPILSSCSLVSAARTAVWPCSSRRAQVYHLSGIRFRISRRTSVECEAFALQCETRGASFNARRSLEEACSFCSCIRAYFSPPVWPMGKLHMLWLLWWYLTENVWGGTDWRGDRRVQRVW